MKPKKIREVKVLSDILAEVIRNFKISKYFKKRGIQEFDGEDLIQNLFLEIYEQEVNEKLARFVKQLESGEISNQLFSEKVGKILQAFFLYKLRFRVIDYQRSKAKQPDSLADLTYYSIDTKGVENCIRDIEESSTQPHQISIFIQHLLSEKQHCQSVYFIWKLGQIVGGTEQECFFLLFYNFCFNQISPFLVDYTYKQKDFCFFAQHATFGNCSLSCLSKQCPILLEVQKEVIADISNKVPMNIGPGRISQIREETFSKVQKYFGTNKGENHD